MSFQGAIVGVVSHEHESPKTYGNLGLRATSFMLDGLVIVPFSVVGYMLIAQGTAVSTTFGITLVAYGVAIGFYNRCVRMGVTGQSWGKMVTGTRLISERTGEPL